MAPSKIQESRRVEVLNDVPAANLGEVLEDYKRISAAVDFTPQRDGRYQVRAVVTEKVEPVSFSGSFAPISGTAG
jgi:hypothetical protein